MRSSLWYVIGSAVLALLVATTARASDWRVIETRFYRIHTDLDRAFAADLAKRLDAMYEEYSRRLADFRPDRAGKLEVYLFTRRADYLKFIGARLENTGGVFLPQRNMLSAVYEGQGRDGLRRTLQHEAFHQFAHSAISPHLPPWLNEGLATVFEEGIWTGRGFVLGEVPPRRVRQLRADLAGKRLTEFREFMSMDNERWTRSLEREPNLGAAQYTQAWAMVHFLVFASDGEQPRYRKRFLDTLKLIHDGMEPQAAFAQALSPNIEGFQARFSEYMAVLEPTPRASMIERHEVLADLLIELLNHGKRFQTIAELRDDVATGRYRLRYAKGEVRWVIEPDPRLYFSTLDGRPLRDDEFFFEVRADSPLPDMVYRGPGPVRLRTRFHEFGDDIHYEVLVEWISPHGG